MILARNALLAATYVCLMLEICRGFFLGGLNTRVNLDISQPSSLDQHRRGTTPSSYPIPQTTALFGRKKAAVDSNSIAPEPTSPKTKPKAKSTAAAKKMNEDENGDEGLEDLDDLVNILSSGRQKDLTAKVDKEIDLDLDLEELEKIAALLPPETPDDDSEEGLAEALRGIENGEFDIDQFFKDGADMLGDVDLSLTVGDLALDDDILGDIDLFAEIGAAATGSPVGVDRKDKGGAKRSSSIVGPDLAIEDLNDADLDIDPLLDGLSAGDSEARLPLPVPASPAGPLTPLEEFKRLMESLGPNSFMDDDLLFGFSDEPEIDEELILSGKQIRNTWDKDDVVVEMREVEGLGDCEFRDDVLWQGGEIPDGPLLPRVLPEEDPYYDLYAPNWYEGGKMRNNFEKFKIDPKALNDAQNFSMYLHNMEQDERIEARVRIISVLTASEANSTALDIVNKVYDYIKAGTENDKDKIEYEIHCYQIETEPGGERGEAVEEFEHMIQMWVESYNTYHLVDGYAMREAWGDIMPHIMLSEKNLRAILDQVKWALHEDSLDGVLLTPRMRKVRFRGGAQEMVTGYNTEELDSEFSVVSVR